LESLFMFNAFAIKKSLPDDGDCRSKRPGPENRTP
jgi:hypothetical protein